MPLNNENMNGKRRKLFYRITMEYSTAGNKIENKNYRQGGKTQRKSNHPSSRLGVFAVKRKF